MAALPEEATEEAKKQSFWMPGHYAPTVRRPDRAHQACGDLKACLLERAAVERSYAAGLSQWSGRWSKVVETRPLYGSLLRAWRAFFSSAERLAAQHLVVSRALVEEEAGRLDAWRSSAFPRKLLCGFTETRSNAGSFARAQKPWASRLQKVEKARVVFHKACQKESSALDKEKQASDGSENTQEKRQKITAAREKASEEKEKARDRYEKLLEDVTSYTPRYMEEMEAIFDQSQEEEGKRIAFLKESFLSIHKHLDITNNENVKVVYSELHHTLLSINEQDDLRWWRTNQGPGMPTAWPRLQEWIPPVKKLKRRKQDRKIKDNRPVMIGGVKVRALYDYVGEEGDELSFKAGEGFLKVEEEDEQGWCRGVLTGGREGFYPANYVEIAD